MNSTIVILIIAALAFGAYTKKNGGLIIGKAQYQQLMKESYNIVLFQGDGWGSYKTLSAVVTAKMLLETGKYKRVYSNIPVSFATSPPANVDKFDFLAPYARDSVYIFDECWTDFANYDKKTLAQVFAYPRKNNQVFLLTSVLAVDNFKKFCRARISKIANYQVFGLPLLRMGVFPISVDKKKASGFLSFWLFPPSSFFGFYNSHFKPSDIAPILQWRDSGTLYDAESRAVPKELIQFFELDSWGTAIPKKNLPPETQEIMDQRYPKFEIEWHEINQKLPKLKKKRSKNPIKAVLGTEFNFSYAAQVILIVWFLYCAAIYAGDYGGVREQDGSYPAPWSDTDNALLFIQAVPATEWKKRKNEQKTTNKPSPTPTSWPQPIEWKRQN